MSSITKKYAQNLPLNAREHIHSNHHSGSCCTESKYKYCDYVHHHSDKESLHSSKSCCHSHKENSNEKRSACACGHDHVHSHNNGSLKYKFATALLFFILGFVFKYTFYHLSFFGINSYIPFFVLSWAFAGYDVVLAPFKRINKGIFFDENFLMSIATIGAFILGEWVEAASVMLFYNLGEIAQDAIVEKSRKSITKLIDVSSSFARVLKEDGDNLFNENNYEIKEPNNINVGSILLIKPGEKVPLDSIVIEGTSEVNTSSMTGESLPRLVKKDDRVLSGFINITGLLVVKVTALLENSEASKMLNLIEEAQERKAKTEKVITSFAKVYTPIVLVLAILISVTPPLVSFFFLNAKITGLSTFAPWIYRGLMFLVISCPCAFILSVPLAYFAGIGSFAKNGILVKGADYIDGLAKTKKIIFDKTGTLTHSKMQVIRVCATPSSSTEEVLKTAFIAESSSNHPIAKAIVEKASSIISDNEKSNIKIEEYKEETGKGISVKTEKNKIFVGSYAFVQDAVKNEKITEEKEAGESFVYVAKDGKFLGFITLQDEIKSGAKDAIDTLKKLKVERIEMLTGDTVASAQRISKSLGLGGFKAELLPREKVECFTKSRDEFKKINKNASVIFMGDGINDAATLSMADVGIAVGNLASDAAVEASDVVLMSDDINLVPKAIALAKRTRRIVKENIVISFTVKIGFLILGTLGFAGLQLAVLADVGVAFLATMNSMRLKK